MPSPTAEWSLYLKSADELFSQCDSLLEELPTVTGDQKTRLVSDINVRLNETSQLIDSMNTLLPEMTGPQRADANEDLTSLRARLSSYRSRVRRAALIVGDTPSMRVSLLGSDGRNREVELGDVEGVRRMKESTRQLEEGTSMLDDTTRVLSDTIEVANGITTELQKQRETTRRIRGYSQDIDEDLGHSASIIRRMLCRSKRNTAIVIGIIVVIVVLIIIIIALIVKHK
ncbi:uncharacterized protein MONOS_15947p1 [Monocercomonoides exilis]|uniref:uncharacterized protein n=1 Tax=Monocercomonoides exilis TaxID=2049356 RepID=UPI00355A7311|nr:hypothetical protein MONOS_15947p1 [Monocercomonoides exilis]